MERVCVDKSSPEKVASVLQRRTTRLKKSQRSRLSDVRARNRGGSLESSSDKRLFSEKTRRTQCALKPSFPRKILRDTKV